MLWYAARIFLATEGASALSNLGSHVAYLAELAARTTGWPNTAFTAANSALPPSSTHGDGSSGVEAPVAEAHERVL